MFFINVPSWDGLRVVKPTFLQKLDSGLKDSVLVPASNAHLWVWAPQKHQSNSTCGAGDQHHIVQIHGRTREWMGIRCSPVF